MSLSSAAFFSENFAGTVSLFAGAPGTARAPLTNTELSAGLSLGACELGSSLPILPEGVCCAFSCCSALLWLGGRGRLLSARHGCASHRSDEEAQSAYT